MEMRDTLCIGSVPQFRLPHPERQGRNVCPWPRLADHAEHSTGPAVGPIHEQRREPDLGQTAQVLVEVHVLDDQEATPLAAQYHVMGAHGLVQVADAREGGDVHADGAQVGERRPQIGRALYAEARAAVAVARRL